jgi:hypothetical protein
MKSSTSICTAVPLILLALAATSSGQLLFQDDFNAGTSADSWVSFTSNAVSPDDTSANFNFNYGSIGIPLAPHSTPGTMPIGLQFLVNRIGGVFQGISASPKEQHFTGDFTIQFDLWINFIGPLPGGGTGSTQMATFGWGTSGDSIQWAGANNSVLFAADGDGGTTTDYRVYRGGGAPLTPDTGVYAAGTTTSPEVRNSNHPYYSTLVPGTVPQAQTDLFSEQTGTAGAGSIGMAWRDVAIQKSGDSVTWTIDGLLFATVSISGTLGGDNITFGMFDPFAGSTPADSFLNATIIDNIRVSAVPEPSTLALLGLAAGGAGMLARPRRAKRVKTV